MYYNYYSYSKKNPHNSNIVFISFVAKSYFFIIILIIHAFPCIQNNNKKSFHIFLNIKGNFKLKKKKLNLKKSLDEQSIQEAIHILILKKAKNNINFQIQ